MVAVRSASQGAHYHANVVDTYNLHSSRPILLGSTSFHSIPSGGDSGEKKQFLPTPECVRINYLRAAIRGRWLSAETKRGHFRV